MKQHWIVKIGSGSITDQIDVLNKPLIASLVEQIIALKSKDIDIILVSSGAIAAGMNQLKWQTRPEQMAHLQAAAAIGQVNLVQCYQDYFQQSKKHCAQILITHDDIKLRKNNVLATINTLLALNITPIINENDTVATEEIRFGDNDTLAADIANLTKAEKLIIITDQQGLYNTDPRENSNAELIKKIHVNHPDIETYAKKTKSALGQGGMYSKILAAKQASLSNTHTHIVSGKDTAVLLKIANQENIGTHIHC